MVPPYFAWLEDRGLGFVFSHWTWLPPLRKQWELCGSRFTAANRHVVARLLTPLHLKYADAYAQAPWRHFLPYCAAKAGLVSLTRGLARELAPAVRVNAIGPGAVLMPPGSSESLKKKSAEASALGRLGEPEDVAAACVFLIEGSDFITGAFLPVDGGALAFEP